MTGTAKALSVVDSIVVVDGWFDGQHAHRGPTSLVIEHGRIRAILDGDHSAHWIKLGFALKRGAFLVPGLIDAHVHLVLDGAITDPGRRAVHLRQSLGALVQIARRNARQALACGVTLIRDAGDRFGINNQIRNESRAPGSALPCVRSAGPGIKRSGRYGSLMAIDVGDRHSIRTAIQDLAATSDEIKVVLTGIIDFGIGAVKDQPQFTLEEAQFIVKCAHEAGRKVLAHCSGAEGIDLAIRAGVDSIEHGFFISRDALGVMRDKGLAWVPTFSPVYFQWAHAATLGWAPNAEGNLRRILDRHAEHVAMAQHMGVRLMIGTDAGSMGVEHGRAIVGEMERFLEAGLSAADTLHAATGAARSYFGGLATSIAVGAEFDALLLAGSPFESLNHLRSPLAVWAAPRPPTRAGSNNPEH